MSASRVSVRPEVAVVSRPSTRSPRGLMSCPTNGSSTASRTGSSGIPRRLPLISIVGSPGEVPASCPSVVSTTMSTLAVTTPRTAETLAGISTVRPTLPRTSSRASPAFVVTVPSASVTAPVMSAIVSESSSSVLAGRPFRPSGPPSCCRSTEMTPLARSIETSPFESTSGSLMTVLLASSSAASKPVNPMVPPPASIVATAGMLRLMSTAEATLPSKPSVPTASLSTVPTPVSAVSSSVETPPTSGELMTSWPSATTYSEVTSPPAAVAVEPRAPSCRETSSTI